MNELFLVLDVFDEVPQFKAAVMPRWEAQQYVERYCEENSVTYRGLDFFVYYPVYYNEAQAFLQVAPVDLDDGVKIGFYWEKGDAGPFERVYPTTDDD